MGYARRTKNFVQHHFNRFCYWLGPTRCVLLGAAILFGSFIVQLLTSIGVPYILSFDFFRFDMQNFTFIELGMWAACNGKEALIIPTISLTEQPEEFNCPPAAWGWIDSRYSGITKKFFDKNLPKALIMHPISCGFTFMAMITALVTMKRQKQHFLLPIFSFFSCLFALASFMIDVATFLPARHKLLAPDAYLTLGTTVTSTSLGPAFWLSLSCFVLDIVGNAIIISGYGIWRLQRQQSSHRRFDTHSKEEIGMSPFDDNSQKKAGSRLSRRGYFNDSTASFSDHTPYMHEEDNEKSSEVERASGTLSALSKHSTSSRVQLKNNDVNVVQDLPSYPGSSHLHHNNEEEEENVEQFEDQEDDDEVGSEDGYDSAISAYADAKSEVDGRSRSRVTLTSPSGDLNNSRRSGDTRRSVEVNGGSSGNNKVKRKPVGGY